MKIKCFDCGENIKVTESYTLSNGNKLYIGLCNICDVRTSTTKLEEEAENEG